MFGVTALCLVGVGSCGVQRAPREPVPVASLPTSGSDASGVVHIGCTFVGRQLLVGPGAVVRVACPPGCAGRAELWGTDIYTADSGVCVAGIHAGAISPEGGSFVVRLDAGQLAYRGSARNGVTSSDRGSQESSLTVGRDGGRPAEPPRGIQANCAFDRTQIQDAYGTAHLVSCPSGCSKATALWGTDVYSGDSSICRAAVHAGIVSDAGGYVVVILDGPQPAFLGSLRNGIWSGNYGRFRSSFHLEPERSRPTQ